MAVLGIVTCEILELEFARLLGEDAEVSCIAILEDSHSKRLIRLLEQRQAPLRRLPHPHAFAVEPGDSLEVLVRVMALGLHRNRRVLRDALAKAVQAMNPRIDALLLGYGVCGGALDDARAALDVDLPVFQPMDGEHPVDDCVALCLGGREPYYAEQRKCAGTFFLTPGWSRHWRRMLDLSSGEVSQPGLKRLLRDYQRALLVPTPVLDDDELQSRGVDFAQHTGLRLETRTGTLAPLSAAWEDAKEALRSKSVNDTEGVVQ